MCVAMLAGLLASVLGGSVVGAPVEGMIELTLHGERIEGSPLAWDAQVVHLLGRDGRLWSFNPQDATNFRQTATRFRPYSTSEMRAMLLRELGGDYEVTGTTHYMVAHPNGQNDRWAERFESFHRDFVHYFSVRGFALADPPFPLVGIVCRNQDEFLRYTAEQGKPVGRGVLGFYSILSNRIVLFDVGGGNADAKHWQQNASTVVHEATHQLAFNTGIQSRYCLPPTWTAEGLATLFEARGVYDSRQYPNRKDRLNLDRLRDYRVLATKGLQEKLTRELTASDSLFRSHPATAYAESWALTFYLVETQPAKFAKYLALAAARKPFTDYTAEQRLADFTSVFGNDWRMLDAQMTRFMGNLD